ncbi:putative phiE125 gp8 family phage protein [Roseovarius sp. MBR-78]|jgi:uncharacterized phiE125 gp8 family phage protein|uniref:head-tail connector protein n=1 Tax=Roseovarius sp. MBR-78 TaxID=3156460 RepID=UPI0033961E2C
MKLIERNHIATGSPVDALDLADHLRVELAEASNAMRYASAAADEIEQHAALALLAQEIVALSTSWPGAVLSLPIGPVDAGEVPTVEQIELDGSATAITTGWTLQHGRFPTITFETEPVGPIRVTYTAGYGADETALPRDLSLAILDQAIRLYDKRGDMDNSPGLAPSTARICARYRRVRMAA